MEGSDRRLDPDESFEVSAAPETASEDPQFEDLNVCRIAALSTLLGGDRDIISDLAPELSAFGFAEQLSSGERTWRDLGWNEQRDGLRIPDPERGESRIHSWTGLNETLQPANGLAFLVAALGSGLERESAAAASALQRHALELELPPFLPWWLYAPDLPEPFSRDWREAASWELGWIDPEIESDSAALIPWDSESWTSLFSGSLSGTQDSTPELRMATVRVLSWMRISLARRSFDPVVRWLASATLFRRAEETGRQPSPHPGTPTGDRLTELSTMIHGTFAFTGEWWRPPDEFFEFVGAEHRPNLYRGGARFHWSGRYRASDRRAAAEYFCDWVTDRAPTGVETVFAHSYGGEVAARSLLAGAPLDQLVLLSVPVTKFVREAAATGAPIVDVRLPFDPVLGLARRGQRISRHPNVTQVLLNGKWRLRHDASHSKAVWKAEDVAVRGGL